MIKNEIDLNLDDVKSNEKLQSKCPIGNTCFYCEHSSYKKGLGKNNVTLPGFMTCQKAIDIIDKSKYFNRNHKCHSKQFEFVSSKKLYYRIKYVLQ